MGLAPGLALHVAEVVAAHFADRFWFAAKHEAHGAAGVGEALAERSDQAIALLHQFALLLSDLAGESIRGALTQGLSDLQRLGDQALVDTAEADDVGAILISQFRETFQGQSDGVVRIGVVVLVPQARQLGFALRVLTVFEQEAVHCTKFAEQLVGALNGGIWVKVGG